MFIQTEATPNPATLKFIPGKPVMPGSTREYLDRTEADESPLAQRLFSVADNRPSSAKRATMERSSGSSSVFCMRRCFRNGQSLHIPFRFGTPGQ